MWWFAALLFLLGFLALDIIVKGERGGPTTPPPPQPAPSLSKHLPPVPTGNPVRLVSQRESVDARGR
jgi:hypothetical protein